MTMQDIIKRRKELRIKFVGQTVDALTREELLDLVNFQSLELEEITHRVNEVMNFDPGHCCGDVGCQMEDWIVNAKSKLEEWQKFYA